LTSCPSKHILLCMNSLDPETRARIVAALVEGVSISSIVRMTGVAKTTILRLVREVGAACARFHDAHVRELGTVQVQCDEIWSFCYAKQRNVPVEMQGKPGFGSIWTWTAIDADTRLIVSYLASDRSQAAADALIADLKSRTMMRLQITSDGYSAYIDAIAKAFPNRNDVDYAEEIKVYANAPQPGMSPNSAASRYSPGRVKSVTHIPRMGMPFEKNISTAYMERWNLTMRMQNRRFTRLTNAFSKKFENHRHMIAMTVVFYNFCKSHKSLGAKTPAQAAGLTDYVWTVRDLLALDPTWTARAAA
jgi:IS1 family transposase